MRPRRSRDARDTARGAHANGAWQQDAVVWACTSGSFVYGWDGANAQAAALGEQLGIPASSTSLAFVHAARALGVGLLCGGSGAAELTQAGAYRVYKHPADLLDHIAEIGIDAH